jgi:hypothetical protein
MDTTIVIRVGSEEFQGRLADDRAPRTVCAILEALPIEATAKTWGDEIYFEIPVDAGPENAAERVAKGDLGYWPAGNCFCIFYGRTPMSPSEDEIVPASAVNVIGSIEDPDGLKKHSSDETVSIRLAD